MLCADLVEVAWEDEEHRARQATAVLEDISSVGACLQFETPVATGTRVHLYCGKEALEGKVRYCVYRDIGYLVGVQFAKGCEWSRQEFEPQHLLDVATLVRNRKRIN
jgi:hypothetical protein